MQTPYPNMDTLLLANKSPCGPLAALLTLFILLSGLSIQVHADSTIPAYSATYKAKYKGFKVKAKRELKHLNNGDIQVSQSMSHFLMKIKESSKASTSITERHIQLQPQHYSYSRKGVGKNKSTEIAFDSKKQSLRETANKKVFSRSGLPAGVQDKLSYQLQLRLDAMHYGDQFKTRHYPYIENGKSKQYSFRKIKDEKLKTGLGVIETAVFERVRPNGSNRSTKIWLAKDWGYLIARIEQKEGGSSKYALEIESATIGKKAIIAPESDQDEGDFGFGMD